MWRNMLFKTTLTLETILILLHYILIATLIKIQEIKRIINSMLDWSLNRCNTCNKGIFILVHSIECYTSEPLISICFLEQSTVETAFIEREAQSKFKLVESQGVWEHSCQKLLEILSLLRFSSVSLFPPFSECVREALVLVNLHGFGDIESRC